MSGARAWMVALLVLACAAGRAAAAVVDSTAAGCTVRHERVVAAAPDSVWRALVGIGRWWSPDHTFSGDARNLSLDPVPGGCFCESLPGGGVRHLVVVYARPPRDLRLQGALGPLQAGAVTGSMTWSLAPDPRGTRLRLEYAFAGYLPGGLGSMAGPVDRVLGEQAARLARLVETGVPSE
jgi:uncharacterized protein YndB with AHSA1/START domain